MHEKGQLYKSLSDDWASFSLMLPSIVFEPAEMHSKNTVCILSMLIF